MKEEKLVVGNKEITIRELNVVGDLKLSDIQYVEKRNVTATEILRQCVSDDDWEHLEAQPKDALINQKLIMAMNRVNGWDKGEVSDEKKLVSSEAGTENGETKLP